MIQGTLASAPTDPAEERATEVRVTIPTEQAPQGLNYYVRIHRADRSESAPPDAVPLHQAGRVHFRLVTVASGSLLEVFVGQDREAEPYAYGLYLVCGDQVAAIEEEQLHMTAGHEELPRVRALLYP